MRIKVGQTVLVNGERKTVSRLTKGGLLLTTDGEEFDIWFDIVEAAK